MPEREVSVSEVVLTFVVDNAFDDFTPVPVRTYHDITDGFIDALNEIDSVFEVVYGPSTSVSFKFGSLAEATAHEDECRAIIEKVARPWWALAAKSRSDA